MSSVHKISNGKLIVVGAAKGGVGKTLVATNLAVALVQFWRARVALVDLDLQLGNVDLMLEGLALEHSHSIVDLIPVIDELTSQNLDFALQTHSSGLRVLLAPQQTRDAYPVNGEHVELILSALLNHFDWVICDCASGADETTVAAMHLADWVLLLVTPDIPCLRGTRRLLELLRSPEPLTNLNANSQTPSFPRQVGLVVNQFDKNNPLPLRDLQQTLQTEVLATLPIDSKAVWKNVSRGTPMVLDGARGMSGALRGLAEKILRQDQV